MFYSFFSFVLFDPFPFLYSFTFYCSLPLKKKKYLLSVVKSQSQNEKTSHCMQDVDGGWSIMHHLLGCCQLGQAHYKLHGPLKERKVHEAICSFFRYNMWLRILCSFQILLCRRSYMQLLQFIQVLVLINFHAQLHAHGCYFPREKLHHLISIL